MYDAAVQFVGLGEGVPGGRRKESDLVFPAGDRQGEFTLNGFPVAGFVRLPAVGQVAVVSSHAITDKKWDGVQRSFTYFSG